MTGEANLPAAADKLATAVRAQWLGEAAARHLDDSDLTARLAPEGLPLAEEWSALVRLATDGPGWPPPPADGTWASDASELGCSGNDIASLLPRIPTRRLVILGEPGAGKTMLLIRLVLGMLVSREPGSPVPVLVSLAGWDPAKDSLRCWLAAQLTIDYPALAGSAPPDGTGRTLAEALWAGELLTPVLDGLDEIPESLLGTALEQVNQALRPGETVVVSSRSDAYADAVSPQHGPTARLRGAAVVRLCPVEPCAARRYLLRDAHNPDGWAKALSGNEHLRQALTTPLMLSLAREIYDPRPSGDAVDLPDPAELCEPAINSREAVERYLLEAFLPAAYCARTDRSRRWSHRQARRYLSFLARHVQLQRNGTKDLAWWTLRGPAAAPSMGLRWSADSFKSKLMLAATAGFIVGLAFALAGKPEVGLGSGLAVALVFCLAAGIQAKPADLAVAVSPDMILARDRSTFFACGFAAGPAIGLAVGLIMGLVTHVAPGKGFSSGPQIGLVTGLVVGPIAWLAFTLLFGWRTGVLFGLITGTADWLVSWLLGQLLHSEFVIQVISGTMMGIVFGLLFGTLKSAWPGFTATRCWLALRGNLPWRFMAFLADARLRSVLRQAGAVYQFRHSELQQHLASGHAPRSRPRPAEPNTLVAASTGEPENGQVMKKVFISYVREDLEKIDLIAGALRDNGVGVWTDRTNIVPGERWRQAIQNAIREGQFFLACFSAAYSQRDSTYMNEELRLAIEQLRLLPLDRRWFIPIMLEPGTIPAFPIDATETLSGLQYIDFSEDWDHAIAQLLEAVCGNSGSRGKDSADITQRPRADVRQSSWS